MIRKGLRGLSSLIVYVYKHVEWNEWREGGGGA